MKRFRGEGGKGAGAEGFGIFALYATMFSQCRGDINAAPHSELINLREINNSIIFFLSG